MNVNAKALTDVQQRAAAMMAVGTRPSDVADAVDVARKTVSAWRRDPVFMARVRGLQDEIRERTLARAVDTAAWALGVAIEAIRETDDPAKRARLATDLYRLCAGQTGLPETTRHEVDQRGASLVAVVSSWSPEERRAMLGQLDAIEAEE